MLVSLTHSLAITSQRPHSRVVGLEEGNWDQKLSRRSGSPISTSWADYLVNPDAHSSYSSQFSVSMKSCSALDSGLGAASFTHEIAPNRARIEMLSNLVSPLCPACARWLWLVVSVIACLQQLPWQPRI